jgi:hypothetical protein
LEEEHKKYSALQTMKWNREVKEESFFSSSLNYIWQMWVMGFGSHGPEARRAALVDVADQGWG